MRALLDTNRLEFSIEYLNSELTTGHKKKVENKHWIPYWH
jgi:hypothetical protein